MKITQIDGGLDRQVITAMVVSTGFLREVCDMYAPELLSSTYARTVAGWCLDHFAKYAEAPGKHIEDHFRGAIKSKRLQKDQVELVQQFLTGLSSEYVVAGGNAGLNIDYLLDETERWFKTRDLQVLHDEIAQALDRGEDPNAIEELMRKRKRIERAQAGGFEPFKDEARIAAMFEAPPDPLFHMPGAAGDLLDSSFTREQFILIEAPEKSTKSFIMAEVSHRACMARCNVAKFEFGDLTEKQMMRREYSSLTRKPFHSRWTNDKQVCVLDCWACQTGTCTVKGGPRYDSIRKEGKFTVPTAGSDYKPCPHVSRCNSLQPTVTLVTQRHPQVMEREDVDKVRETILRRMGNSRLLVRSSSSKTMTIADVEAQLERWKEQLGFVPDVIIGDYFDIMAQEPGTEGERESQNLRAAGWRRISQDWHCLCLVATQANAASRGKENLGRDSWSECKTKDAHITGKIGIHRTLDEEKLGLVRLSWLLGREQELGPMDQVVLVQQLRIAQPMAGSFWRDANYRPKELIASQETEDVVE